MTETLGWLAELCEATDEDHRLTIHCETRDETGIIVVRAPVMLWVPGCGPGLWVNLWTEHDGGDGYELAALRQMYDAAQKFRASTFEERIVQWLFLGDSITPYEIMGALADDTGWRAAGDSDGEKAQWELYNLKLVTGPDARALTEFGRKIGALLGEQMEAASA